MLNLKIRGLPMTLSDKYKKDLKNAWSNLESDKLRKMYWILHRMQKDSFVNEFDLFKMETYKEILNERYEW